MLSFCIQHQHWGARVGPHAEIQVAQPPFQPSLFSSALCAKMPSEFRNSNTQFQLYFCLSWD
jgi:hypothetical protein